MLTNNGIKRWGSIFSSRYNKIIHVFTFAGLLLQKYEESCDKGCFLTDPQNPQEWINLPKNTFWTIQNGYLAQQIDHHASNLDFDRD